MVVGGVSQTRRLTMEAAEVIGKYFPVTWGLVPILDSPLPPNHEDTTFYAAAAAKYAPGVGNA